MRALSAINSEVDTAVRSLFTVKDYFVAEEGAAEYSVLYDSRSGENFLKLLELLKKPDYSAQLYGEPEHATLLVVKNPPPVKPQQAVRLSAPAFLFLLTLLSVLVVAYVTAVSFTQFSPGGSVLEMSASFAGALVGAFLVRYLAQRYAARRGNFSALSYFLPNVPLLVPLATMTVLPTFGSVSFPRTPPANRNMLFDFYMMGSVAMAGLAFVVAGLGAGSSVILNQAQYSALLSSNPNSTVQTNPSLLQTVAISLAQSMGLLGKVPDGGTLIFSPLGVAAWLALLLAFFNLIPAGLLDGGRMALLSIGEKATRRVTIVAGLLLLLTDVPNYLVVFLLILLMAAFPVQGETLDSISELSRSRKTVFFLAIALGLLCVPVPQSFGTFPF